MNSLITLPMIASLIGVVLIAWAVYDAVVNDRRLKAAAREHVARRMVRLEQAQRAFIKSDFGRDETTITWR